MKAHIDKSLTHLFNLGLPRRQTRSIRNSIWFIVKRIKQGIDKLVDTYIYHILYKINNIKMNGEGIHSTIDEIVSDAISDIDNRLNKHKAKVLGWYV